MFRGITLSGTRGSTTPFGESSRTDGDTSFTHPRTIVDPMLFESMLAIGAVLLIASGGAKLADRAPTRGALSAAGLPSSDAFVVALALTEVAAGAAALVVRSPFAALLVAVLYLGFAVFVLHALRRGLPIQSCGCFGKVDAPPTSTHVVVTLLLAVGAVGAASGTRLVDRLAETPTMGTAFLVMTSIGAYLTYLLLAELPRTLQAARGSA